jgi:hypothetical protein
VKKPPKVKHKPDVIADYGPRLIDLIKRVEALEAKAAAEE